MHNALGINLNKKMIVIYDDKVFVYESFNTSQLLDCYSYQLVADRSQASSYIERS